MNLVWLLLASMFHPGAAFAAADRGEPDATIALAQLVANQDESAIARASALERLAQLGGENAALSAEAAPDLPAGLLRQVRAFAGGAAPETLFRSETRQEFRRNPGEPTNAESLGDFRYRRIPICRSP